ncbi:uncharacterized protein LOC119295056 isoform X1 [Triticum dicoccoides]|uniref:uncharacterized protein LOC119295056 isoform X1 n=1 Tax=Triticum dicoccoides TaxID=85692 RepID=UPI000E78DB6E|nr:uncharacterized protein LOC119295056 isoform X1 [Triticum dicoccoides]
MALRAAVTGLLQPAAVPVCDGFICLVPMLSAGFAEDLYLASRFGGSKATREFEIPRPFALGDVLRETGKGAGFLTVDEIGMMLPKLRLRPEDSYYIFGASAAAAGMLLLSAEEPIEPNDGQTSEIIHDLKAKLSEVTERAENLAAENKRLLEDVDKVREANKQHGYESWIEALRSIHEEELAKLEARSDKEGDGSGNDNKDNRSGKKGNESDKKDKKPLAKKLLDLLMAPSTAESLYQDITTNWTKWGYLFGMVPVFYGFKKADFAKIFKGDFSGIDPRVEVVESRACPCGIPWPQKCSRCGRGLPNFVGDSGLVSFPGIAGVKGETFTAVTPTPVPRATSPQPPQP